jgi:hypothetical protein
VETWQEVAETVVATTLQEGGREEVSCAVGLCTNPYTCYNTRLKGLDQIHLVFCSDRTV